MLPGEVVSENRCFIKVKLRNTFQHFASSRQRCIPVTNDLLGELDCRDMIHWQPAGDSLVSIVLKLWFHVSPIR